MKNVTSVLLLSFFLLTGMGVRPELPERGLDAAKALFYAGQHDRARARYSRLAASYSQARLPYAAFLFATQDYAGAEKAYASVLASLSPRGRENSRLWFWVARAQADQGHWDACLKSLDSWAGIEARQYSLQPDVLALRAEALQALGREHEAGYLWEAALMVSRREPGAAALRFKAATFLEAAGDTPG